MTDKKESTTEKMRKLHGEKELNVEQLDAVVGGSLENERADDSRFLNVLLRGRPGQCNRYGEWKCNCNSTYGFEDRIREIEAAWKSVGITAVMCKGYGDNVEYYLGNEVNPHYVISRQEAWTHAMKVVGKKLVHSDWYW